MVFIHRHNNRLCLLNQNNHHNIILRKSIETFISGGDIVQKKTVSPNSFRSFEAPGHGSEYIYVSL